MTSYIVTINARTLRGKVWSVRHVINAESEAEAIDLAAARHKKKRPNDNIDGGDVELNQLPGKEPI